MRKDHLFNRLRDIDILTSRVHSIYLLKRYMETKQIVALSPFANISFNDYLLFIRSGGYPHCADLFKPPYLPDNSPESKLLTEFISSENAASYRSFIAFNNGFTVQVEQSTPMNFRAQAVALTPDGKFLCAKAALWPDGKWYGGINLRDESGKFIKNIANIPASSLAILPNGHILCGKAALHSDGKWYGNIILLDQNGNFIKVFSTMAASSLALLPDGNILVGTAAMYKDGKWYGSIHLIDAQGQWIKKLIDKPASTLAICPDNRNFISGCAALHSNGKWYGNLSLRCLCCGNYKNCSVNIPTSTFLFLPNGEFLHTTYALYKDAKWYGSSYVHKGAIINEIYYDVTKFYDKILEMTINLDARACHEFHKGAVFKDKNPGFAFRNVPIEILREIYTYVLQGPIKDYHVMKSNRFLGFWDNNVTTVSAAAQFAKNISETKFTTPSAKKG